MSDENNPDEIPVEVISEDKMETKNSLEESKNIDNIDINDSSILINGKKIQYDLIILSVGNQSILYEKILINFLKLIEKFSLLASFLISNIFFLIADLFTNFKINFLNLHFQESWKSLSQYYQSFFHNFLD